MKEQEEYKKIRKIVSKKYKSVEDCKETIKSLIRMDEDEKYYIIGAGYDLNNYPQHIVDSFLDFVNKVCEGDKESESILLGDIYNGRISVRCTDD